MSAAGIDPADAEARRRVAAGRDPQTPAEIARQLSALHRLLGRRWPRAEGRPR